MERRPVVNQEVTTARPDRSTAKFVRRMREAHPSLLDATDPRDLRELRRVIMDRNGPGPKMFAVTDHEVEAPGGPVAVRVLVPTRRARGVIAFFHGGGWVAGSLSEAETVARKLAERTACAIALIEYRTPTGSEFPAVLHRSFAALTWVADTVPSLVGRSVPLMIAGEGAGGNLAAVLAVRARDAGAPQISLQILVTPLLEHAIDEHVGHDTVVPPATIRQAWDRYAGDRRADPLIEPVHTDDLRLLPAAVVVAAECDPSRAGAQRYAEALGQAGVEVDVAVHPGQMHGFFSILELPGSELGYQHVIRAVRLHLAHLERVS